MNAFLEFKDKLNDLIQSQSSVQTLKTPINTWNLNNAALVQDKSKAFLLSFKEMDQDHHQDTLNELKDLILRTLAKKEEASILIKLFCSPEYVKHSQITQLGPEAQDLQNKIVKKIKGLDKSIIEMSEFMEDLKKRIYNMKKGSQSLSGSKDWLRICKTVSTMTHSAISLSMRLYEMEEKAMGLNLSPRKLAKKPIPSKQEKRLPSCSFGLTDEELEAEESLLKTTLSKSSQEDWQVRQQLYKILTDPSRTIPMKTVSEMPESVFPLMKSLISPPLTPKTLVTPLTLKIQDNSFKDNQIEIGLKSKTESSIQRFSDSLFSPQVKQPQSTTFEISTPAQDQSISFVVNEETVLEISDESVEESIKEDTLNEIESSVQEENELESEESPLEQEPESLKESLKETLEESFVNVAHVLEKEKEKSKPISSIVEQKQSIELTKVPDPDETKESLGIVKHVPTVSHHSQDNPFVVKQDVSFKMKTNTPSAFENKLFEESFTLNTLQSSLIFEEKEESIKDEHSKVIDLQESKDLFYSDSKHLKEQDAKSQNVDKVNEKKEVSTPEKKLELSPKKSVVTPSLNWTVDTKPAVAIAAVSTPNQSPKLLLKEIIDSKDANLSTNQVDQKEITEPIKAELKQIEVKELVESELKQIEIKKEIKEQKQQDDMLDENLSPQQDEMESDEIKDLATTSFFESGMNSNGFGKTSSDDPSLFSSPFAPKNTVSFPSFGNSTPSFGQPSSNTPVVSLPVFGQSTSTSVFGQSSLSQNTPVFGQSSLSQTPPVFGQSFLPSNSTSQGNPSSTAPAFSSTTPKNPTFGQSSFGQPSFGQPSPSFGQSSFGQPSFGQPSFGQPSFGQSSFGQSSFGQPSFGQPSFGMNSNAPSPQTTFGSTSLQA